MIDSFNLGVAAEFFAASVLIEKGWDVLLPFDRRSKYDLAGIKEGIFSKFQVKRASWVSPSHTSSQYLRVQTQSKGIQYTKNDIDYFIFVSPERHLWMVPVEVVNQFKVITLDKRVENERHWTTAKRFKSECYQIC